MNPDESIVQPNPEYPSSAEGGQYGTGVRAKKKKHIGLYISLICLIVLLVGALVLSHFFTFRFEQSSSGFSFRLVSRKASSPLDLSRTESQQLLSDIDDDSIADEGENVLSLPQIYAQVNPSVVSVSAVLAYSQETATGVILTSDGYIVTNSHLLENCTAVNVLLSDNMQYRATIVATDEQSDLAVLKINAAGLKPATLGDSDRLQVGESVVAIGNPLGLELRGTMTSGIISAINRDLELGGAGMTLIQTDAALNNGNSGGPLINSRGEVIGINTAKISGSLFAASVEGIGFAIPSNTVRQIVNELMEQGYVSGRSTMKLTVADVDALQRAYLGLPQGVFITSVEEASNAYAAGLRYGDILVKIDEESVASADRLSSILEKYVPGDEVHVIIFRNAKYFSTSFLLEEQTG